MHLFFDDHELEEKLSLLVKPKKMKYQESDLGFTRNVRRKNASKFPVTPLIDSSSPSIAKERYQVERSDFKVQNIRGESLACSLYECPENKQPGPRVVGVFLHGNAGTRLDGVRVVNEISCHLGLDMCCFDFSGCGLSDGSYVTLGLKEEEDLQAVTSYLVNTAHYSKLILFGRSMGGVTALLFCSLSREWAAEHVLGIIIDSAFSSLKDLAYDMAKQKLSALLGGFLTDMSLPYLRELLKKMLNGYDILSLEIIPHASVAASTAHKQSSQKFTPIPALFAYSREDSLVLPYHAERLIEAYSNAAESFVFTGDHNASRSEHYFTQIRTYIKKLLEPATAQSGGRQAKSRNRIPSSNNAAARVSQILTPSTAADYGHLRTAPDVITSSRAPLKPQLFLPSSREQVPQAATNQVGMSTRHGARSISSSVTTSSSSRAGKLSQEQAMFMNHLNENSMNNFRLLKNQADKQQSASASTTGISLLVQNQKQQQQQQQLQLQSQQLQQQQSQQSQQQHQSFSFVQENNSIQVPLQHYHHHHNHHHHHHHNHRDLNYTNNNHKNQQTGSHQVSSQQQLRSSQQHSMTIPSSRNSSEVSRKKVGIQFEQQDNSNNMHHIVQSRRITLTEPSMNDMQSSSNHNNITSSRPPTTPGKQYLAESLNINNNSTQQFQVKKPAQGVSLCSLNSSISLLANNQNQSQQQSTAAQSSSRQGKVSRPEIVLPPKVVVSLKSRDSPLANSIGIQSTSHSQSIQQQVMMNYPNIDITRNSYGNREKSVTASPAAAAHAFGQHQQQQKVNQFRMNGERSKNTNEVNSSENSNSISVTPLKANKFGDHFCKMSSPHAQQKEENRTPIKGELIIRYPGASPKSTTNMQQAQVRPSMKEIAGNENMNNSVSNKGLPQHNVKAGCSPQIASCPRPPCERAPISPFRGVQTGRNTNLPPFYQILKDNSNSVTNAMNRQTAAATSQKQPHQFFAYS